MPEWVNDLVLSDWVLLALAAAIAWFVLDYGLFTPWWDYRKNGLVGAIIMEFNSSYAGIVFLIVWATIFGQRIDEFWRVLILTLAFFGALGKIAWLHHERRQGKLARRRRMARDAALQSRSNREKE